MKNKKNRENYYLNVIGIISCRRNKIDTLLSSIKLIGKVLKKNIQFDKKVLYYIEYKYYYMRRKYLYARKDRGIYFLDCN